MATTPRHLSLVRRPMQLTEMHLNQVVKANTGTKAYPVYRVGIVASIGRASVTIRTPTGRTFHLPPEAVEPERPEAWQTIASRMADPLNTPVPVVSLPEKGE